MLVHVGNLPSEILVVQSAQMTNEDVIDLYSRVKMGAIPLLGLFKA
jgi:hypothetical protein